MARYSSTDIYMYSGEDYLGDAPELFGRDRGGHDNFFGEDGQSNYMAVGDAIYMGDRARGGNDEFFAGEDAGTVMFIGDAHYMGGRSIGGNDEMHGGENSMNILAGDGEDMFELARGGRDDMEGGDAYGSYGEGQSFNLMLGDAYSFGGGVRIAIDDGPDYAMVRGGNDDLHGGDAYSFLGGAYTLNAIAGDAYDMYGISKGGADHISGGDAGALSPYGEDGYYAHVDNLIAGDALMLGEGTSGGADDILGGSAHGAGGETSVFNAIFGDGYMMFDEASAGDDVITGGSTDGYGYTVVGNYLVGDLNMDMRYGMTYGDDTIVGGSHMGEDGYVENLMFGDLGGEDAFFYMVDEYSGEDILLPGATLVGPDVRTEGRGDFAQYGDDHLTGGENAHNIMVGDAEYIGWGEGGDDIITGGGLGSYNEMYGDAIGMGEDGIGGNDQLVSGMGEDVMWGDAGEDMGGEGGADRFVFDPYNGSDMIMDFDGHEGDRIVLRSFRAVDRDGFRPTTFFEERVSETEDGVWVDLSFDEGSEGNGVLIVGATLEDISVRSFLL